MTFTDSHPICELHNPDNIVKEMRKCAMDTSSLESIGPSPEIKDISSPLTIISGISYYTSEQ